MKRLVLCGLLLTGMLAAASEKYFFHLAGRDFTKAEAIKLAGNRSDLQNALRENIAAALAVVLCSQIGRAHV